MLNALFGTPEGTGRSIIRVFEFNENSTTATWQPYIIPRNHSMLFILGIGGGGGGGAGFSAASTNPRGGGGGGSTGTTTRAVYPRLILPDVVFVKVGNGGNVAGSITPAASYVSVISGSIAAAALLLSAPGGNNGGNGTAGAAGGGAGTTSAVTGTGAVFFGDGLFTAIQGQAGVGGGVQTGANGNSITYGANGVPLSGGAGGAGVNTVGTSFAGGDITGAGLVPTVSGGAAGSNNGGDGIGTTLDGIIKPWLFTGGAGGGSNDGGVGGNGGNGGIGCGGGGGGGGTTGGSGGNGGSGLILIASW